jgi:acyl carrier protein
MTDGEILSGLQEIVREVFDNDAITLTPSTTAADIEGWDSVNHINIVVAAEVRFRIKFKTAELESMKNIGDFIAIIQRQTAARGR